MYPQQRCTASTHGLDVTDQKIISQNTCNYILLFFTYIILTFNDVNKEHLLILNLEVFKTLLGRCHELKGDKKGLLSLDLEHPLRLIFEPSNKDINKKNDGGMDWNLVNAVKIIDVENTHD